MNKKAVIGDDLSNAVIYILLLVIFVGIIFAFVNSKRNDADFWEDLYAKKVAHAILLARPGTEISIDLNHASEIARDNGKGDLTGIIDFDNNNKKVIVDFGGAGKKYSYLSNVLIVEKEIEMGVPVNILKFKVIKDTKIDSQVQK